MVNGFGERKRGLDEVKKDWILNVGKLRIMISKKIGKKNTNVKKCEKNFKKRLKRIFLYFV